MTGHKKSLSPTDSLPLTVSITHLIVLGVQMGAQQWCYDRKQGHSHPWSQEELNLEEELTVWTASTRSGLGSWETGPGMRLQITYSENPGPGVHSPIVLQFMQQRMNTTEMFCWNKLNLQITLLIPGHPKQVLQDLSHTWISPSHCQLSQLNSGRQEGSLRRWSVMESQRHPPFTESAVSGVRNRRKEMKGTPHLSCSHGSLFQYSGSLSKSNVSICKGNCIKNQTLRLEPKRITLKVYYVLISLSMEKEIFWLKIVVSCSSGNSTNLWWTLLLKSRNGKIIWQKHSQKYRKVETITLHNSGNFAFTLYFLWLESGSDSLCRHVLPLQWHRMLSTMAQS